MEETMRSVISIIIAFIGLYLVSRIWLQWQKVDIEVLKARVFLDKKFLSKNWIYTFLAGASLTVHNFFDFVMSMGYFPKMDWIVSISDFFEIMVFVFLVILAHEWFRMICRKADVKT